MTNKPDQPTNEDAIEAIAAGWFVEREEDFASGRAELFAQWCERDSRHRAAVARLEGTHRLLKQLPRLRDDDRLARRLERMLKPEPARVIPFPYFRLAAAAAVLALTSVLWWFPSRGDYQHEFATTGTGATKVTLPDKSRVELNVSSNVVVKYSARQRHVELTRGEANFSVAKDAARPFVVAAGKINVVAVGTVFKVRFGAGTVEVMVSEGKVQVSRAGSAEADALVAGQSLEFRTEAAGDVSSVQTVDSSLQSAVAAAPGHWLVFDGDPLWKVVQEFNRRNQVQLVIVDDEIADRPVGGKFEADQVEAFVRILESSGEISTEWNNPRTFVLRKGN